MQGLQEIRNRNAAATRDASLSRQRRELRHVIGEAITMIEAGGEDDDVLVKLRRVLEETA